MITAGPIKNVTVLKTEIQVLQQFEIAAKRLDIGNHVRAIELAYS